MEAVAPTPTVELVRSSPGEVIDPEIGIAITELGLVYGVEVDEGMVRVELTTTTPVCPLGQYLARMVTRTVSGLEGVQQVEVELVNAPPWTPEMMSDRARRLLGWAG